MDNKLLALLLIFTFIFGAYTILLVGKFREKETGCTVTYRHGDKVNVLIGEWK
jgi:hypothetical protein